MKVYLKGTGTEITLNQKDFIAKGGEGNIYGKGNWAYKIYDDHSKMIPIGKIQELSVLDHPNIIKPDTILVDVTGVSVGYTMRLLKDTYPLVSLFTKAFRLRNNIDNKMMLNLVKDLQNLVSFVHSKRILIVDLNEMNFLASNKFDNIFAIDVNSYQTPNYNATVIMDSVRDRHAKILNKNTDWFSFGIVAFQMLIGIHPYKGNHPKFESLPRDQVLEARMLKNVSVFHKDASVPKICQQFDVIPPVLRDWFIALFENGKRCEPPSNYDIVVIVPATTIKDISGAHLFNITELMQFSEDIIHVYSASGDAVLVTQSKLHVGKKEYQLPHAKSKVAFDPKTDNPIFFWLEDDKVKAMDVITQTELAVPASGDALMEYDGRMYVKNETHIIELFITKIGNKLKILPKEVGKVMDVSGATSIFEGVILQNMMGTYYATVFPTSGQSRQIRLTEVVGYKVIDAKYENKVLVVVAVKLDKKAKYDRFVFRLSPDYTKYDVRIVEDISYHGINFTVSDKDVCILMTEDEKLEVFPNGIGSSIIPKRLDDKVLSSDMRFYHHNGKILFTQENHLYQISMR